MGSAAPLLQPVEPGQTVPGAAPSSKFSNAKAPPLTVTGATSCRRAGDEGAMPLSKDVVDVHRGSGKIRTSLLRPGNRLAGTRTAVECGGRATSRVAAPRRCECTRSGAV